MASKKGIIYFKEFIGKNPELIDPLSVPDLDKEDEKIRKNIEDKFSEYFTSSEFGIKRHIGFDGSQNYSFKFREQWNQEDKKKKQIRYNRIIEISKSGNNRTIEYPCDLERFLSEKGFKKQIKFFQSLS
jgi:hypothetical protein